MKTGKAALRGQDIRRGNEKLVLRLILERENLSQSEVVELTGLKAPTILRIFTNLEEQGLIQISTAPREAVEKKGRKPVFYCINPDASYVIGVEFWASSATVIISNLIRQPVYSQSMEIDGGCDGNRLLLLLVELIQNSIREAGIEVGKVIGVGVGAPGRVNTETGMVLYYSRIKGLTNFDLKKKLEEKLDLPVRVHNNCSVLAMNECSLNPEYSRGPIMALLIRGGVGGAYVNEGKVFTAGNITATEIGHLSIQTGGRECSCGRKGCLESYLSEGAVLGDLADYAKLDSIEELEAFINKTDDPEVLNNIERIIQEKGDILVSAAQNLNNLFSPEIYLIISRSRKFCEYLSERAEAKLKDSITTPGGSVPRFIPVEYNPLHAGMGACDIIFNEYLSQNTEL